MLLAKNRMAANRYHLRQKEYRQEPRAAMQEGGRAKVCKELTSKVFAARDLTPEGRDLETERFVWLHAPQGPVGHGGPYLWSADWLSLCAKEVML